MVGTFLEFIKTTGIFLICAECILYFAPGNSYQKYIRVLIGIMVLAQFMIPLKALVGGLEREAIEQQVMEFQSMMDKRTAEMQTDQLQLISNSQEINIRTVDEIKSKLNNIATEQGYVIEDIIIDKIAYVIVNKDLLRGVADTAADDEEMVSKERNPEETDPKERNSEETNPEETNPEETNPKERNPKEINPIERNPEDSGHKEIKISKIEIGAGNREVQSRESQISDADTNDNPDLIKLKALFCEALGTGKAYLEVIEGG